MAFQRFEHVRNQRGSTVAVLGKDGRMLIPSVVVEAAGLAQNDNVELYFDGPNRMLGFRKVDGETLYSVKIRRNSIKKDGTGETLAVSFRTLLTTFGIILPERLRGKIALDPDGMVVFTFAHVGVDNSPTNGALVSPIMAQALGMRAADDQGATDEQ